MEEIKWSHAPGSNNPWMAEAHGYIIEVAFSGLAYQYGIYKFTLGGVSDRPLKFERTRYKDMRRALSEAEDALRQLLDEERVCGNCGEPLGTEPRAEIFNPEVDGEDNVIIAHQEPCATWLLDHGWEIA